MAASANERNTGAARVATSHILPLQISNTPVNVAELIQFSFPKDAYKRNSTDTEGSLLL